MSGDAEAEPAATEMPLRELRDPLYLRALAHPARLRLIEELAFSGPMTATELASRVGESAANCSWHLRQLARYGFVEEAGGGTGRRRPWQVVVQRNQFREHPDDPELAAAGKAAADVVLSRELEALQAWRAAGPVATSPWRDVPFVTQSFGWLTAEELAQANDEIMQIVTRHLDRVNDPTARPAGARPIRFMAWGIPATDEASPIPSPATTIEATTTGPTPDPSAT